MACNGTGVAASTGSPCYSRLIYVLLLINDLQMKDSTLPVWQQYCVMHRFR